MLQQLTNFVLNNKHIVINTYYNVLEKKRTEFQFYSDMFQDDVILQTVSSCTAKTAIRFKLDSW